MVESVNAQSARNPLHDWIAPLEIVSSERLAQRPVEEIEVFLNRKQVLDVGDLPPEHLADLNQPLLGEQALVNQLRQR